MPLATLSSTTLAYEIAGDGPPLVWCHGLGSCRDGDRHYLDALTAHFTVLSYDARGHGVSAPVRDEALFTYPHLSSDLIELLAFVGWERALLAGSSMGAGTIIRVAMQKPLIPTGVFMIRPGSGGGPAPPRLQALFRFGAAALRSGGLEAAIEFLMTIPEARETIQNDPERVEGMRRDWERHDPESIAAALEGIPSSSPLSDDVNVADIVAPVLVVPGNDPIHATEYGLAVAELIPTASALPPFNAATREEETRMLVDALLRFSKEIF